jgi:hypothetical protein
MKLAPATPPSTIEAMMHELRERGLECFSTPANQRRLLDCDKEAMDQMAQRLTKLPLHTPWSADHIEQLVHLRAKLGKGDHE